MGGIIFWTIVRMVITIPAVWILGGIVDYQYWWILAFFAIYVVVLHPAVIQFKSFEAENKDIIETTLCSSCKNFDKTAVLCIKYDQHPTIENLPCEGNDWEPIINESYEEKEYDKER